MEASTNCWMCSGVGEEFINLSLHHWLAFNQVCSWAEGILGHGVVYKDACADEEWVCGVLVWGGVWNLCLLPVEPLQWFFLHDPWTMRHDKLPWGMGHAMPYDTVCFMGHGAKISHRSWYAQHLSHNYYFPMTHGAYSAVQSMGHGV